MPFITQGKTSIKYILIVVVLAAIAGGGILGYQYWWAPKHETKIPEVKLPEAKAPEVKPPEEATKDETVNWETYQNKNLGFSVQYPAEWYISGGKFTSQGLEKSVVRFGPVVNKTVEFGADVAIFVINNPENLSVEEFVKKYNAEGVSYKKVSIGGLEGKRTSELPGPTPSDCVFVKKGSRIYVICLGINENGGEKISSEVFDKILSTFKFSD